jgi:RND family efflux transporter MFP subunit
MRTLIIVSVALAVLGCGTSGTEDRVEFRVPVTVEDVGTGEVEDRVVATGTLRAPETVTLTVQTTGIFEYGRDTSGRRLAEGDRVQAGQTLAIVTGEDVRVAAGTEASRQRYESAKRDYDSKASLYQDGGLISEQELRAAETTLADAKLDWERSLLTEEKTRLVTPIDGVILKLGREGVEAPVADGQRVPQGFAAVQVAPLGRLIADVDLIGTDISRVRRGLPARVRHHAWEERIFNGRVIRLAPALDPNTRTFRAEVEVRNNDKSLRPGMFVEVTMIVERREEVLVVPRTAVTERAGSRVVFVLKGQRVSQRPVVLGLGDDEIVEIREGIEPGDRVVVRGLETLTDGTRVRRTGT